MYKLTIYKTMMVRDKTVRFNVDSISTPQAASNIAREYLENEDREHFIMLLLNTSNRVIGIHTVSIGTLTASLVHPREVFKIAILANAKSILLAHNHPSGNLLPSQDDIAITKRLFSSGALLGIDVTDHIIVGEGDFFSFQEKGLLHD